MLCIFIILVHYYHLLLRVGYFFFPSIFFRVNICDIPVKEELSFFIIFWTMYMFRQQNLRQQGFTVSYMKDIHLLLVYIDLHRLYSVHAMWDKNIYFSKNMFWSDYHSILTLFCQTFHFINHSSQKLFYIYTILISMSPMSNTEEQ